MLPFDRSEMSIVPTKRLVEVRRPVGDELVVRRPLVVVDDEDAQRH